MNGPICKIFELFPAASSSFTVHVYVVPMKDLLEKIDLKSALDASPMDGVVGITISQTI